MNKPDKPKQIDDDDLARIDELSQIATPGPWVITGFANQIWQSHEAIKHECDPDDDSPDCCCQKIICDDKEMRDYDACFISACREFVPKLVAEIRRLQEIEAMYKGLCK